MAEFWPSLEVNRHWPGLWLKERPPKQCQNEQEIAGTSQWENGGERGREEEIPRWDRIPELVYGQDMPLQKAMIAVVWAWIDRERPQTKLSHGNRCLFRVNFFKIRSSHNIDDYPLSFTWQGILATSTNTFFVSLSILQKATKRISNLTNHQNNTTSSFINHDLFDALT